jgi:phage I-like protein
MQLRAFSQSACSTSRPAVGPRGVPALRCSSRPARRAAPSSQPAHVGAQVVCRAAQEQALSPEERWTAAVAEGRVINVSNKEAGEQRGCRGATLKELFLKVPAAVTHVAACTASYTTCHKPVADDSSTVCATSSLPQAPPQRPSVLPPAPFPHLYAML